LPGPQTWEARYTILNNTDAQHDFTVTWHATHDQTQTGTVTALPAHYQKSASLILVVASSNGASEPVSCDISAAVSG
jgi:hypothetical protein